MSRRTECTLRLGREGDRRASGIAAGCAPPARTCRFPWASTWQRSKRPARGRPSGTCAGRGEGPRSYKGHRQGDPVRPVDVFLGYFQVLGVQVQPHDLRPNACATASVVPLPAKGSRTVAGTVSALQPQVGCQPRVWALILSPGSVPMPVCRKTCRLPSVIYLSYS